ncbi:MAG: flagellar biosynthetic protein FliR [Pseudomonadota bacterium]
MVIESGEITAWVGSLMWPFIRVSAMLFAAPLIGTPYVQVRIRVLLALLITIVLAPNLDPMPTYDPASVMVLLVALQQVLIGLAMGLVLQLVFSAIVIGGQIMALQMGLGFASMVDPQTGTQVPMVSQIYLLAGMLVFLAFDGHLIIIEVLADSFTAIPVGFEGLTAEAYRLVAEWGSHMFAGAVLMAIPVVASLLVVNIAFGVMTRASPQLNIFAVGFPVTMTIGFGVMILTFDTFLPHVGNLVEQATETVRTMLSGG